MQNKDAVNAAATVIASDLRALEHKIDETLAQAGLLLQNLSNGRMASGFSATVGQPVFDSLGQAIPAAMVLRGHVVDAHNGLAKTARRMGVNTTTLGPFEDKPKDDRPESPYPKIASADGV